MSGLADFAASLDTRWVLVALLFALDLWAIGLIALARPPIREGLLWGAIVLVCPVIGCLFWYVLGPKPDLRRSRTANPTTAGGPATAENSARGSPSE